MEKVITVSLQQVEHVVESKLIQLAQKMFAYHFRKHNLYFYLIYCIVLYGCVILFIFNVQAVCKFISMIILLNPNNRRLSCDTSS